MGYDASATIPVATASTAGVAPTGLYVGPDRDHSPYRPPTTPRRGWRIAIGPPVVTLPPTATASTAAVAPTVAVSLASLTVPETSATADTLAPDIAINFQAFPSEATADSDSTGPEILLAAVPDLATASAAGIAPPTLYVGPNLYPVPVTGAAAATADTLAPAVSISYTNTADLATASSATVAPTITPGLTPATITGSAISSTTSVTIPSHSAGDIIVIFAGRGSSTTATKPSASGTVPAWVDIDNGTFSTSASVRTAYFVATGSTTTSGTWTNATSMVAVVLTQQNATPIGGHGYSGGVLTGTPAYASAPAITLSNSTGKSAILHYFARFGAGNIQTPSGYTALQTSTNTLATSKNDTTTDGAVNAVVTSSPSGPYATAVIEITPT